MNLSPEGPRRPQDRRRYRRYPVQGLRGTLVYRLDAKILNVSLSGVAVEVATPLPEGKKFGVRLGPQGESPALVGTVRWCRLHHMGTGEKPIYHAGLSFREVLTEQGEELFDHLKRHIVVDDHRLFGRVRAREGGTVSLESDFELKAREISLSGMRFETSVPARVGELLEVEVPLGEGLLRCRVRVVALISSEVASGVLRYDLGVELLGTSAEQRSQLESFLRWQLESQVELPDGNGA